MSCSDARRARRLARKRPKAPDYIFEPERPGEWRAEIEDYIAYYEDKVETDQPLIRERIDIPAGQECSNAVHSG